MTEQLSQSIVMAPSLKSQIMDGIQSSLSSLALLDRSARVRQVVDLAIPGIGVDPIPPHLGQGQRAILVSNYPSVSSALRAVIKVSCRLPGDTFRLSAIARPEVVTQANSVLVALGIAHHVFPVHKDEAGVYRLDRRILKQVLDFLEDRDSILWMSITGSTRGNGLLEEDRRTGAAQFALSKGVPLVPMALVSEYHDNKPCITQVRFGEPIDVGRAGDIEEFDRADYLNDMTRLAMCKVAELLPPGQRSDFEDLEAKFEETYRRLRAC